MTSCINRWGIFVSYGRLDQFFRCSKKKFGYLYNNAALYNNGFIEIHQKSIDFGISISFNLNNRPTLKETGNEKKCVRIVNGNLTGHDIGFIRLRRRR